MKKLKKLFLVMAIASMLIGCEKYSQTEGTEGPKTSMFVVVEKTVDWEIVADRKTGVMYAVSGGGYNRGTFELLVDADGKPLIYDGI